MIAKEILTLAKTKISNQENWCKISAAKKKQTENVEQIGGKFTFDGFICCGAKDPEACQWCASGAVDNVIPTGTYHQNSKARQKALIALDLSCPEYSIISFNDNRYTSHNEIMDVFDKAIEIVDTVHIENSN